MVTATVFFVTIMLTVNGNFRHSAPVETMEECAKMVETSKVSTSNGGDNEATVLVFCTPLDPSRGMEHRFYGVFPVKRNNDN